MKFVVTRTSTGSSIFMKFVESRTGSRLKKPCKEARSEYLTYFIDTTLKTIESAKKYECARLGNPVQMNGFVRVYNKKKSMAWTLEIDNLEDLIKFTDKYGEVVIKNSYYKEIPYEIEIYDDYRE